MTIHTMIAEIFHHGLKWWTDRQTEYQTNIAILRANNSVHVATQCLFNNSGKQMQTTQTNYWCVLRLLPSDRIIIINRVSRRQPRCALLSSVFTEHNPK